jgi:hypothetical protein
MALSYDEKSDPPLAFSAHSSHLIFFIYEELLSSSHLRALAYTTSLI